MHAELETVALIFDKLFYIRKNKTSDAFKSASQNSLR